MITNCIICDEKLIKINEPKLAKFAHDRDLLLDDLVCPLNDTPHFVIWNPRVYSGAVVDNVEVHFQGQIMKIKWLSFKPGSIINVEANLYLDQPNIYNKILTYKIFA